MQEEKEPFPGSNEDKQIHSDARAFSQHEMVACETCQRANPPTRTSCLYCGAALPITDAAATLIKPTLRPLESWEQGFNAILLPGEYDSSELILKKVSDLLRLDVEDVKVALASGCALPLARCASHEEATLVRTRISDLGLSVLIVADGDLDSCPPRRVRTFDLTDDALVVHPTGHDGVQSIPWRDITLMVTGRRIVRRLEVAERPDKKRGKEVVDSRELSTDAERLDLYSSHDDRAWRVAADNFDFSCLGEVKALMASKNFQTLTDVLRERAQIADYDDSYFRVRQSLSLVWPLEQRTESMGLSKPRMWRVNTGAATTSDNEMQFTRYSRLLHQLKMRQPGLKA